MRTLYRVALALLIVPVLALAADTTDVRSYVGGAPIPTNINWELPDNWSPAAAPTLRSAVSIGQTNPYVAVTSQIGAALSVTVQSGGILGLRAVDHLKVLAIVTDLTIESGGSFLGVDGGGKGGPIVVIGGNIINNGLWDLSGIATGHPAVALVSLGTQRISGSQPIVFENLIASRKFIVDGIDVYVLGKYFGPWPDEVNGGRFIVGEQALPITLAYFNAAFDAKANGVALTWQTISETNNYGFYVERRSAQSASYEEVAFVPTQGNGIVPHSYSMTDPSATSGAWYYRLRQVDMDGTQTTTEDVLVEISSTTSVEDATAPVSFGLEQNYPNPFNPKTVVSGQLPVASRVRIAVYDLLGKEVAVLADEYKAAGVFRYDFDGSGLSSGTYICRMTAGQFVESRKMVLTK